MIDEYRRTFAAFAANGGGRGPEWLATLRRNGMDRFAAIGFPTTHDEEWRFTPVSSIARVPFTLAPQPTMELSAADVEPFRFGHDEWPTLVFVNGRYSARLSYRSVLPPGVQLRPLSEVLESEPTSLEGTLGHSGSLDGTSFTALNAAFLQDGAVLSVASGVELPSPMHFVFVATRDAQGVMVHPRNVVQVGDGARVNFIESYLSLDNESSYLTNAVTEVRVGSGAWVEHVRVQRESEAASHIGWTEVHQARDSHYRSFTLALGGRLSRLNLHARSNASNTETLLYGLYLTRNEQLADTHTAIFHDHPNCRSWEVYKGILTDRSRAVFNGKVFVKPEAQKTDAKQTNRNLLLSEGAKVNTKPQLEIFADDVKCTHGATVGRLDETAHFYLQSRGIPRVAARKLLTYAFAAEVVNEVTVAPVREALGRLVWARLAEGT